MTVIPLMSSDLAFEDSLHADDVVEVGVGDGRSCVRVCSPLHGPLEVVGCHALAVVEFRVLANVERVEGSVVVDLPTLRDVGYELEVGVEGNEAAEDLNDKTRGRRV